MILNWSGELRDSEGNIIGKVENSQIEFPELSEDQTDDEFVIKLGELENPNETSEKIWRLMKKGGLDIIKKKISIVLKELRAGGKWNPDSTKIVKDTIVKPKTIPKTTTTTETKKEEKPKPKSNLKFETLEFVETFRAPPSEIYDCLMNEKRFQFYTRVKKKKKKINSQKKRVEQVFQRKKKKNLQFSVVLLKELI